MGTAYGDINDMDDEPSKSIHWEFLCSCERDKFRIETPTPTPTPTLTPTPTNTPTPTPTFEDVVCWCDEYAPWHFSETTIGNQLYLMKVICIKHMIIKEQKQWMYLRVTSLVSIV